MNAKDLAGLFVEYAEVKEKAEELKAKIEKAVLENGVSVTIAGVKATYYQPSYGTPDYRSAAIAAMPHDFDLSPFTKVTESTSWKDVCEALQVEAPAGEEKPARVVVK